MNEQDLDSPKAIQSFLAGTRNVKLSVPKQQRYDWISQTLKQVRYLTLSKKDKSTVREYIRTVTGYSHSQLTRLIAQYKKHRQIGKQNAQRNQFPRCYTREDIILLAQTDEAHQTLSGTLTKKLFERAHHVFQDDRFKRLCNISISHIYNLRKSTTYQRKRRHYTTTQRSKVKIAQRRKPKPEGRPGFIRIDTVHQGDQDKQKGVYHINAVDEVTQFEVIASVEKISENYLIDVLEAMLNTFPFSIINFHSDSGSEYINHRVARLLNKLNIEFTKSRARHCNDNALAETKNGAIVRKYLGYIYIDQKWAPTINDFYKNYLVPYLNYHRPCHFAERIIDKKGKEKKIYLYKNVMTPYERLRLIDPSGKFLKTGITHGHLETQAKKMTDLQAAREVRAAQKQLFQQIFDEK